MDNNEEGHKLPIWGYSPGYERVMREGHLYPAPTCGSPSLIWHMAIAPRRRFGDRRSLSEPWRPEFKNLWDKFLQKAYEEYDNDYDHFIEQLNTLAARLQTKKVTRADSFTLDKLKTDHNVPLDEDSTHSFFTASPQTLSFTFWWPDPAFKNEKVNRDNNQHFLRVQTQIQTHTGYATITFIIDAAKPYGENQIETSPVLDALTEQEKATATTIQDDPSRRGRIRRALNVIRCSSLKQIRGGAIEQPRLPEMDVKEEEAKDLLDTADYLFKTIWEELVDDFNLDMIVAQEEEKDLKLGQRFADFRGHVMSVSGLETEELEKLQKEREDLKDRNTLNKTQASSLSSSNSRTSFPNWRPGYGFDLQDGEKPHPLTGFDGFGRFHTFDAERNEGHSVLRSLWPFIRRLSPWADYRELVGCGVMNWRALYISTLGFDKLDFNVEDETPDRLDDVPGEHLPLLEKLWFKKREIDDETGKVQQLQDERKGSKPVRFLLITKGEPHKEQLGRFIERLTSLETGRIFALRDIVMIRNAGTHIELIGRMLDGLLEQWSKKREEVENTYSQSMEVIENERKKKIWTLNPLRLLLRYFFDEDTPEMPRRLEKKWVELEEEYIKELSKHIKDHDRHAVRLAAALDGRIGARGAGRILYAIKRSELSIKEFERLLPSLHSGNIAGWTSYPQFVDRGLKPSFDFIQTTGERLTSMRSRLQTITETIQTAALIAETEATRLNTQALKDVARFFAHTRMIVAWGFLIVIAITIDYIAPVQWKPSRLLLEGAELARSYILKIAALLF